MIRGLVIYAVFGAFVIGAALGATIMSAVSESQAPPDRTPGTPGSVMSFPDDTAKFSRVTRVSVGPRYVCIAGKPRAGNGDVMEIGDLHTREVEFYEGKDYFTLLNEYCMPKQVDDWDPERLRNIGK